MHLAAKDKDELYIVSREAAGPNFIDGTTS